MATSLRCTERTQRKQWLSASERSGGAVGQKEHRRRLHVSYLLHVVVESDAHPFFATEHLAGHERVEDSRAGQWEAEIETKQPPVLDFLVELLRRERPSEVKVQPFYSKIYEYRDINT